MVAGTMIGTLIGGAVPAEEAPAVLITGLETNGLVNPIGVDAKTPAFDWKMVSERTGAKQTSYQIVVKDGADNVAWDSGEVESDRSTEIAYEGEELSPQTVYHWNVSVKDEQGEVLTSEENTFETSLMDTTLDSWSGAKWIGAPEYPLDAAAAAVFDLSMTMQLSEESPKAGIVLGGGDFRLKNKAYNIWGSETEESYVNIEVDGTDAAHPVLNLYAVGFPAALQEATDDATVQKAENDASEPDFLLIFRNL